MSTYTLMQTELTAQIDPGGTGLASVIQDHIKRAVKFYKRRAFRFNEGRLSLSTADGTETYSPPTSGNETLLTVDDLYIVFSNRNYPLYEKSFAELEEYKVTSAVYTGRPIYWAYHDELIYLYPIPDAVYTVYCHGILDLGDPDTVANSAWFDEAYELIMSRARFTIYRDHLHDMELAQAAQAGYIEAEDRLRSDYVNAIGSTPVKPWH